MGNAADYASYFGVGMKIGVGIPMPNSRVFVDWALIHEIDEDLVTLQLSRDQLPVGVRLHVGQLIDLRGGKDEAAYSCRAIVVIEGRANFALVRLIGEIVTDQLREFYRIDTFLPVKYYLSGNQDPDSLRIEWQNRCQKRLDDEIQRKQQPWDLSYIAADADLPPERRQEPLADEVDETGEQDSSWDTIIPLAASISGGGIRIVAHQQFQEGQYVPLEIMVPSTPRRIVDAIGQVVFATRSQGGAADRESYNVALKFVFIDERDRDAIVNHVTTIQLQRIRQLREHFALLDGVDAPGGEGNLPRWKPLARNALLVALLCAVLLLLYVFFWGYGANRPKGEIAETFESGIRRYLQKIGR